MLIITKRIKTSMTCYYCSKTKVYIHYYLLHKKEIIYNINKQMYIYLLIFAKRNTGKINQN